jgi:hypothetical protein
LGAASVIAFQQVCDFVGELMQWCAFGFVVHGAGSVVVGEDVAEVVSGVVGVSRRSVSSATVRIAL